ncbi:MAG: GNAT family N-acetyltransferase [Candidatus Aquilonibacter sp.]|jgi:GNAT superfamily N-acetyltransferase
MQQVTVRPAQENDVDRLADLLKQLGYTVAADALVARLRRLDDRRTVLVAQADSELGGCVSVSVDDHFVEGFEAVIEGFVVDERLRSRGVGRQLLAAAERWARARGAPTLIVHSNVVRERAHAFYLGNGYEKVKAQCLFRKRL